MVHRDGEIIAKKTGAKRRGSPGTRSRRCPRRGRPGRSAAWPAGREQIGDDAERRDEQRLGARRAAAGSRARARRRSRAASSPPVPARGRGSRRPAPATSTPAGSAARSRSIVRPTRRRRVRLRDRLDKGEPVSALLRRRGTRAIPGSAVAIRATAWRVALDATNAAPRGAGAERAPVRSRHARRRPRGRPVEGIPVRGRARAARAGRQRRAPAQDGAAPEPRPNPRSGASGARRSAPSAARARPPSARAWRAPPAAASASRAGRRRPSMIPSAIERKAVRNDITAESEISTVSPEKRTAMPAVSIVTATASRRAGPSRSRRRGSGGRRKCRSRRRARKREHRQFIAQIEISNLRAGNRPAEATRPRIVSSSGSPAATSEAEGEDEIATSPAGRGARTSASRSCSPR